MPIAPPRLYRLAAAVFACLPLTAGCGDDDDSTPGYTATFAETECWQEIVATDPDATCGYVTVPENRDDPAGRQIEIAVARINARNPMGRPPLVFLEGGPSASSLQGDVAELLYDNQELILFDQRGVGYSRPALDCPEREEALWATFNMTGDPFAEVEIINQASRECIDRLRGEGVQIDSYNTVENAKDLADIRQALEIEEWDLYGFSYGTTLALESMRSQPNGIRSVILDGVSPPNRGVEVDRVATTGDRAFDALEEACAASELCSAAVGGSFLALLDEVRASFDAEPMELEVPDQKNDGFRSVRIDGGDVVAGVFNSMYRTDLLPQIPSLLAAILNRNEAIVIGAADQGINERIVFYEGMFLAVECIDRGRFWPAEEVETFLESRPELISLYNFFAMPACSGLDLGVSAEAFNDPVPSDIPTLVFGGEFDPVTPPHWAEEVAATLGHASYFLAPGIGHGVLGRHECPADLTRQHLAAPGTEIDDSCIEEMRSVSTF